MAVSLWSKAFGRALYPALRTCRCSHAAFGSYGRSSLSRHASSAVQLKDASSFPTHTAPETLSPVEDMRLAHDDQPKFETLDGAVSARTLKSLTQGPFHLVHMSPVQAAVLPLLPQLIQPRNSDEEAPRDLMVKARTGTGKTLAFLVPAVEHRLKALRAHADQVAKDHMSDNKVTIARAVQGYARRTVGALIISPTRELATQIANEAIKLTKHHDGFEVRLLVGGLPKGRQMREWNTGRLDIVVATPGRLRDLIENEPGFEDSLKTTEIFILDEADTLLDMGFQEDIQAIQDVIKPPQERQTFMFSATMPAKVRSVARSVLSQDHTYINCVPEDAAPTHLQIPQYYTVVPNPEDHLAHIIRLLAEDQLSNPGKSKVLVFLPTTRMVKLYSTLSEKLGKAVLPAGSRTRFYEIHSQKNMQSRINTSDSFRRDSYGAAVMFTSDVSARGVDYPGVTRIVQVGVPSGGDIYVHRVGRTGRGSNMSGRADLVLMPWEANFPKAQLSDIPVKKLSMDEHMAQVAALAQKYDANPSEYFPTPTSPHKERVRVAERPRPGFQADVASRLGEIQERFAELQGYLSEEDVQSAMSSLLAFYASNTGSLRLERGEVFGGVQRLAETLLGKKTHLRAPREFAARERRSVSYKRDSFSSGPSRPDRRSSDSWRERERHTEGFDWESSGGPRSFGPRKTGDRPWEGRGRSRR